MTVEALKMVTLEQYQSEWQWLLTTVLGVSAFVDVVLAASLCFYLRKRRSSAFERSILPTLVQNPSNHMFLQNHETN